jgi:sodium/potassium-transporting ATPase subunit alpha
MITQGAGNTFMLFAITVEISLTILAGYFYPLNVAFGTRDNIFKHFGTPAIPFALWMALVD